MAFTRRLTGTARLKSILDDMACCRMKLLKKKRARHDHMKINCKTVGSYLNTRASEVKPAIAIPTWSSIRNIFCWYDASSPVDRYIHINNLINTFKFKAFDHYQPWEPITLHASLTLDQQPQILVSQLLMRTRLDEVGLEVKKPYYQSRMCF